ncbi:hypothetical protein LSH36_364g01062 [Paralvinella palmiformis]|uniref:Large ribosomal subunit protein mL62 n=1 Tax=Paralvinella palmiformis TaxID=53620 RepID=A0AAD9N236_9ANNE|nr:hypothetical protein LSH36_364g01062 [Paralvinella palmiformis]
MFSRLATSGFRIYSSLRNTVVRLPAAGYQSQYSIEKLYPNSSLDFTSPNFKVHRQLTHTQTENDKFSGYIPVDELDVRYSRSSGPGGQNVNKVSTKVEVRFHVQSASWIPDFAKEILLQNEQTRITKDGFLVVRSEKTRKQMLNQADCLEKIRSMIWRASILPREPTEEEIAIMEKRKSRAKQEILREKRAHSLKKRMREGPGMNSL